MSRSTAWMALLSEEARVTLPWLGGKSVHGDSRRWTIRGRRPPEHGWHVFQVDGGRKAVWEAAGFQDFDRLEGHQTLHGYLVGDRLIPDGAQIVPDPARIIEQTLKVHLVEAGLERFSRARIINYEGVAWVFDRLEFPLGPEAAVLSAFLDRSASVAGIKGVTPALELAFRFVSWRRDEVEARRRRAEERRQAEAHRRRFVALVGTGEGRRQLAAEDFEAAARAALAVSGATLLDHRPALGRGEVLVRFRHEAQRFECVVEAQTLRIIDSGICLVDHATGEKGDTYFTLESLPGVISQAVREGRLVVFRHAE